MSCLLTLLLLVSISRRRRKVVPLSSYATSRFGMLSVRSGERRGLVLHVCKFKLPLLYVGVVGSHMHTAMGSSVAIVVNDVCNRQCLCRVVHCKVKHISIRPLVKTFVRGGVHEGLSMVYLLCEAWVLPA